MGKSLFYEDEPVKEEKEGTTEVADEKITSNFLVGDSVIETVSMTIKEG